MNFADELLDQVHQFTGRFVAYPSEDAHIAHTLWIVHAHLMDAWEATPRIAFLSPEPASGKTRALEVTGLLVPSPVEAVNVSAAYLFRRVGAPGGVTVLFDEIDAVFGARAKENEDLRGLLNAGHRRGAVAGRCVVKGKTVETEEFPAYAAVALAGLGALPDTILTRSVVVAMKRRAPSERVEAFRRRVNEPEGHALRVELASWADSVRHEVAGAWPVMPAGIEDRDADVWEPLLAVADAAGGEWPDRARVAAVALVAASRETNPSLGIRLLSDIRNVFDDEEADALPTATLLTLLTGIEEAPWGDLRGKPLESRGLAKRLSEYRISSGNIRVAEKVAKGYRREDFYDAWLRYLPDYSPSTEDNATNATSATREEEPPLASPPIENATRATSATNGHLPLNAEGSVKPALSCDCDATHFDVVDCDKRPFWTGEDGRSAHCHRCHPQPVVVAPA